MKGQARLYGSQEHQGKRQKFGSAPRSRLASMIARMAEVLDLDLLEAALGVSAHALQDILSGRGKEQEAKYAAHIWHQVEAAGIPATWFNDPSVPIPYKHQVSLRSLAAQSSKKSAIRRHNFKILVKAFDGRLDALADGLEILEHTVAEIATGTLPFDDQRFGHINPRLVAAGFQDGWLEQPDAVITDDLIANLVAQGAEDYEQSLLDSQESASSEVSVASSADVTNKAATPVEASEVEANKKVSHQSGAKAQEVRLNTSATSKKEIAMKTPRGAKPSVAAPSLSHKEFKAAGIPGLAGATLPMQPRADGAKAAIPRGAMATGRNLGKPLGAAKPAGSKAATLPPLASSPASKPAKQAKGVAAKQAAAADSEIREISMRRADALEKLLESARRGAKVTLWRDMLKSSLGYWGNIRRSQVFLRDPLANDITTALGLPQGWLDNPVFPPPTLSDWVMNADVPLPGKAAVAPAKGAAKAQGAKVGVATPSPAPRQQQPQAQKAQKPSPAPAHQAPIASQAAPAPAPAPQAQTAQGAGVDWQPSAAAQPVEKLGPIVTALVSVIQDLGLQGKLTEQEALKLLNGFMSKS